MVLLFLTLKAQRAAGCCVLTVPVWTTGQCHVERRLSWCLAMACWFILSTLGFFALPDEKGFSVVFVLFKVELGLYFHLCEDSETHLAQIQLVGNSSTQAPKKFAVHISNSKEKVREECNNSLNSPSIKRCITVMSEKLNGKMEGSAHKIDKQEGATFPECPMGH